MLQEKNVAIRVIRMLNFASVAAGAFVSGVIAMLAGTTGNQDMFFMAGLGVMTGLTTLMGRKFLLEESPRFLTIAIVGDILPLYPSYLVIIGMIRVVSGMMRLVVVIDVSAILLWTVFVACSAILAFVSRIGVPPSQKILRSDGSRLNTMVAVGVLSCVLWITDALMNATVMLMMTVALLAISYLLAGMGTRIDESRAYTMEELARYAVGRRVTAIGAWALFLSGMLSGSDTHQAMGYLPMSLRVAGLTMIVVGINIRTYFSAHR